MAEPTPSVAPKPPKSGSAPIATGGASPPPQQFIPETDVHLLDRLAVLYRYRRLCVTVFVLVTAAMMIQGYSNVQFFRRRRGS